MCALLAIFELSLGVHVQRHILLNSSHIFRFTLLHEPPIGKKSLMCDICFDLICSSFGVSGGMCYVIVAFPAYCGVWPGSTLFASAPFIVQMG